MTSDLQQPLKQGHFPYGNKPAIVYVHGAFASHTANGHSPAFNYYKLLLKDYNSYMFSYDWNTPTSEVGEELYDFIVDTVQHEQPLARIYIIGHSLGGNVALHACKAQYHRYHKPISRVFTVGSPLGGSRAANLLRFGYKAPPVFSHISTTSPHIADLQLHHKIPVTSFVTTRGLPSSWLQPNDGVVTVASQQALEYPEYITVDCSHLEVLLSESVATTISNIIKSED